MGPSGNSFARQPNTLIIWQWWGLMIIITLMPTVPKQREKLSSLIRSTCVPCAVRSLQQWIPTFLSGNICTPTVRCTEAPLNRHHPTCFRYGHLSWFQTGCYLTLYWWYKSGYCCFFRTIDLSIFRQFSEVCILPLGLWEACHFKHLSSTFSELFQLIHLFSYLLHWSYSF